MTELKVKIFGEIIYGKTLKDVMQQVEGKHFTSMRVQIYSAGGSIVEGEAIKQYLLSKNVHITTECWGLCGSMATIIFLIGKKRIAHEGVRFFVHRPFADAAGNSTQLQATAKDLEAIEAEMINLYMKRDKKKRSFNQWKKILDATQTFGAKELLEMGFATETKSNYQSTKKINMNIKNTLQAFRKLFSSYKALDVSLEDGTLLEVLTDNDTPRVGDSVVIKETGEIPPAGTHVLSDGGIILTDENGIIVSIEEAPQETAKKDSEYENRLSALEKANSELSAKIDALVAVIEKKINGTQANANKTKTEGITTTKLDIKALHNKILENQKKLYR